MIGSIIELLIIFNIVSAGSINKSSFRLGINNKVVVSKLGLLISIYIGILFFLVSLFIVVAISTVLRITKEGVSRSLGMFNRIVKK